MFYVQSNDSNHEGEMCWFDSIFEATCFFYDNLSNLEDSSNLELGSMESQPDDDNYGELDGDWDCLISSTPENRI
jgi:hypothetical protein